MSNYGGIVKFWKDQLEKLWQFIKTEYQPEQDYPNYLIAWSKRIQMLRSREVGVHRKETDKLYAKFIR